METTVKIVSRVVTDNKTVGYMCKAIDNNFITYLRVYQAAELARDGLIENAVAFKNKHGDYELKGNGINLDTLPIAYDNIKKD